MPKKSKPLVREYSYRTLLVLIYKVTVKSGHRWVTIIIDRDGEPWPGCISEKAQYCNAITNRLIDTKWPELPQGNAQYNYPPTAAMRAGCDAARAEYLRKEKEIANA